MHLLDEDSDQQQQQSGGAGAGSRDTGGGGSTTTSQGTKDMGQKARYQDGTKTFRFVDVTKDKTRMGGTQCHMVLDDGNTYVHANSDKQVYLGAEAGKATFDYVVTLSGPCVNTKGKIS
jgi:hypothetical protein